MNTFLEAAVRRSSSKQVLLKISQYPELKETPTQVLSCKKQPRDVNILIDFIFKMLG